MGHDPDEIILSTASQTPIKNQNEQARQNLTAAGATPQQMAGGNACMVSPARTVIKRQAPHETSPRFSRALSFMCYTIAKEFLLYRKAMP
jgi:hypothetical protein